MRTTVRLDDALLDRAKKQAARRGRTLTSLIDQGLRLALAEESKPRKRRRVHIPVSKATGGTSPGVDLECTSALLDRMDGIS